jgi:hypothetical protein
MSDIDNNENVSSNSSFMDGQFYAESNTSIKSSISDTSDYRYIL